MTPNQVHAANALILELKTLRQFTEKNECEKPWVEIHGTRKAGGYIAPCNMSLTLLHVQDLVAYRIEQINIELRLLGVEI